MKKIIYIVVLLISLAGTSCKDSFLELSDPNAVSPTVMPTTMGHIDLLLNAIYADQHSFGLFGHDMLGKNLYCLDHTWDLAWRADKLWVDLCSNDTKPDNGFMQETWRDSYRGIQHCNNLIELLPGYEAEYAKTAEDKAKLKLVEGQARFMRAWFYYYLVNFWGEDIGAAGGNSMGVPLIKTVAASRSDMVIPRASVKEVWDFIIEDLKAAESLLSGTVWTGADQARVSPWAVKGFLGKAYVFTEDWANAKSTLKDVIDNSGKGLVSYNIYKDMFNGANEFNNESLFEISVVEDKSTWGAWGPSVGSGVAMVIAPCFMNNGAGADGSGWSNGYIHDKNMERFGFNLPMYTFIANPAFDASKDVSIDNQQTICDPAYLATSANLRDTKAVDPRLWIAALQPYLDSMTVDGRKRAIVKYKDSPAPERAWSCRKYVKLDGNEYSANVNNGSNFLWLRMADIYLLYAEACVNTSDNVTALEYINKVKRRAYNLPVNGASAIDYVSLSSPTMATDASFANSPLMYERFAELFGEGDFWFSVRRWKIGASEADYYKTGGGAAISWQNTDYAQPIPKGEMETNSKIVQNPGY